MQITDPDIEHYAEQHSTPESPLVRELVETSYDKLEYTDMLSGRLVGNFLKMLVMISGASRVIEIGTFSGYSALMMAEALPENGSLVTCEINEKYREIAESFFDRSEHGHKVTLRMGPALETLQDLEGPYDLAFLDADKVNYPAYCDTLIPMLRPGGLLVVDNAFWSGDVLDPKDEKAEAIHRTNRMIGKDERVDQVVLPVRDGLNVARKK